MKSVKRTVMFTVIVLACAGVYGALRNLPIISGCAFYGECPQDPNVVHEESDAAPSAATLSAAVKPTAP